MNTISIDNNLYLESNEDGSRYNLIKDKGYYAWGCVLNPNGRKRCVGYFFLQNNELFFKFAGNTFKMSGSKKYEATIKKIDLIDMSWISINTDRKNVRRKMDESLIYRKAAIAMREIIVQNKIEEMIAQQYHPGRQYKTKQSSNRLSVVNSDHTDESIGGFMIKIFSWSEVTEHIDDNQALQDMTVEQLLGLVTRTGVNSWSGIKFCFSDNDNEAIVVEIPDENIIR